MNGSVCYTDFNVTVELEDIYYNITFTGPDGTVKIADSGNGLNVPRKAKTYSNGKRVIKWVLY